MHGIRKQMQACFVKILINTCEIVEILFEMLTQNRISLSLKIPIY